MLNLAQLLRVPHVDSGLRFNLSPDGKRVVFSWNKTGIWELWEKELHASTQPKLVTKEPGAKFSPTHSPDGSLLAYAMDMDGSESFAIYLHNQQNQANINQTPFSGYAHQPNFCFSPDGKTLAILSDESGQFSLYLLDIESKEKRLLLDLQRPMWDVTWSPDGQWLAVEVESTGSERAVYVVDIKTGQYFSLGLNAQHPAWSPDSKQLLFSGESSNWFNIGAMDMHTRKIEWITQSNGDDLQPSYSPSGESISWVHAEGAKTLIQVKKRGADLLQFKAGDGVHFYPRFASDDEIVFVYEDPAHPPDLWMMNLENGLLDQLTDSMPTELKNAEFIQPEEITYPGKDGAPVPALLYRAKNAGADSPAVINIHGGPNWAFQFLWYPFMSHMASRGWTVLAPNYRGSTCYGMAWQNASRFDMGGVDTDDCAAGAEYLIREGLASPKKIGVTGRSHGGYLTFTCMTRYAGLWAVGSAVVPFLNWFRSHEESREDLQHWNIENMGDPKENYDLWYERSPYFFLEKINAPVQMICGANDPRCPAVDVLDARDKLNELGKINELILYENEGHSFLQIQNVIDAEEWRAQYLASILER